MLNFPYRIQKHFKKMELPIPYGRQFISNDDISAVVNTLRSDYITQGPKVKEFEEKFADYVGADYAVAVANGTAALHLSALAMDVNKESKVITTPITFAATANCVRYCGGEVFFTDIDPDTALLDINNVRELLEDTKDDFVGIIPVHFAGYPVDMEAFRELAEQYGLWLIEDACHAPGGWFTDCQGKRQLCGNGEFADLSIFSFHPVKHIACGEGGMITTNNEELYKRILQLRSHGITKDASILSENHGAWYYEMHELGYNYRMPDILCSLGISQLNDAEEKIKRRKEIAQNYNKAFEDNSKIKCIIPTLNVGHAYHLYIIQVENRKRLYEFLRTEGILTQVHYIPVHTLPYYEKRNDQFNLPYAETYYQKCLSLPLYPSLTEEQQDYVIRKVLQHLD